MTPTSAEGRYASHSLCDAKKAVASVIPFQAAAAFSFPDRIPAARFSSRVPIQRAPYDPASATAVRYEEGNACLGGAASIHGVQSGCCAAHSCATQPFESTHAAPVGPALAPPPPRDIRTPGHSPLTIRAPWGGSSGNAT